MLAVSSSDMLCCAVLCCAVLCCVADFGLAVNHLLERPVTRLGTLDYMAPEVWGCGGTRRGVWEGGGMQG
jgi:serine/threonine protein kinase